MRGESDNMKKIICMLLCVLTLLWQNTPAIAGVYKVVPGDTLWDIATKFKTKVDDLMVDNPQLENPDLIFPGDVVRLRQLIWQEEFD